MNIIFNISHKSSDRTYLSQTFYLHFLVIIIFLNSGCDKFDKNVSVSEMFPILDPDYTNLTIPPNIAPLNFQIKENGSSYHAIFTAGNMSKIEIWSRTGKIQIPEKKWRKILNNNKGEELKIKIYVKKSQGTWTQFKTISNKIAIEPIDKYLYYRIIYPGFESWADLSINCRDLGSFNERPFIENSVVDGNCINCHSFNNGNTDNFLVHVRGSMGGTYFYTGGKFKKMNLKTSEMKNAAVYPRWHPSGKYVAFSTNKIIQQFHAVGNKKVEVSDLESSLILYDVQREEIMDIDLHGETKFMDTYPEWSPDGKYLYFCRALQIGKQFDYNQIKYDLYRVSFDAESKSFGEPELVFNAAKLNKSVSFPRISPNGRFLVIVEADYGCFPVWHKEADLYLVNLNNMNVEPLGLNSDFAESYHSWSSNGKWLVFSSKRDGGLTSSPYIAYINDSGISDKPFILPQKDPAFYKHFIKSFNVPEFSTFRIKLTPGNLRKIAKSEANQASWKKK